MAWRETLVLSGVLFVVTFSGALGAMSFMGPRMAPEILPALPEGSAVGSAAINFDPHTRSVIIAVMPDLPLNTVCIQAIPDKGAAKPFHAYFINGQPVETAHWTQRGCRTALTDRGEAVTVGEGRTRLAEVRTPPPEPPPMRKRRPGARG